jgi:hypothetical protein
MRFSACFVAAALAVAASCEDPFHFDTASQAPEVCPASREWLPNTPPPVLFQPLPHPASECPFYRGGWQNFLIATQPDASGEPAFLSYPTIDTVFQSAKPHPPNRSVLGDVKQAGGRQILIDQNGNPIFYGIHVNQAYADFISRHQLQTQVAIMKASPRLFFPAGVVEFKSAWQIVEDGTTNDDFISVKTTVPTLSMDADHHLVEDRNTPRMVSVRLLALHVVFTLPGHPEFVWATFEHTTIADVLYKAGTPANLANQAINETDLMLDAATQKFEGQQTSIYRLFPASKSNTTQPDDAISSLNSNVEVLFAQAAAQLDPADQRGHYRLVGAVWMDKPEFFDVDRTLENDDSSPFFNQDGFAQDIRDNGTDSGFSILAGEDRLSSMAMESFTQAPNDFPNCFSCHNTQAVTDRGVPLNRNGGMPLLDPKLINVSHVLSQFLLEESQ